MKLLLTGGSGFIGRHTVEHFLRNTDWEIVVLDMLSYAGDVNQLTDMELYDPERVRVVWHDLRAPIMPTLVDRIGDVDFIINMASESHVERSISDPNPFVMNNVALALNMLDYARQAKPEKFIQISTDEVYGPAPVGHDHIEWDTYLPSNPYSASKAAQESIAYSYWRTYNVPLIITNCMNLFGERQHTEKFIPMTIKKLANGEKVPVHAELVKYERAHLWEPGSRFYLHARNLADALLFILDTQPVQAYPDFDRPTKFNVVGEQELTNLEVVDKIAEILGKPPLYEFVDFHSQRPGHDRRYALDGTKLREAGWHPPFSLEVSLKKTVLWTVANQ